MRAGFLVQLFRGAVRGHRRALENVSRRLAMSSSTVIRSGAGRGIRSSRVYTFVRGR
ncbi:hypothetical protein HSR122_0062 [Halapricum desulfuricans]|uniref:Uncharacterized protein n=1 Tax=Halapricum desulfuricans TaxID=2841257 RepID=A0A897N4C7_9EURY|nr:hypothetical protein HSR122_0062 [Halapricum desulfuricans]